MTQFIFLSKSWVCISFFSTTFKFKKNTIINFTIKFVKDRSEILISDFKKDIAVSTPSVVAN